MDDLGKFPGFTLFGGTLLEVQTSEYILNIKYILSVVEDWLSLDLIYTYRCVRLEYAYSFCEHTKLVWHNVWAKQMPCIISSI